MVATYFQDELHYLRELGRDFSRHHPELAPFLAESSSDPSVERMLEGFAFLTSKLREKIDDELPEVSEALLQVLAPHFVRPIPSLTIMQCRSMPKAFSEV
ncbi:MAG: type VI secretion system baseplate subunit TssF, partial [Planctomycetota bacterium]